MYDIPTCYMKFLKYDSFWHQIESIPHVQLKNHLVRVKVQSAPNTMAMNGVGSASGNLDANIVVVFSCLVISAT